MDKNFSLSTSLIASGLTIFAGFIVFVLSQIYLKFILDPLIEYRKIKAEIAVNLVYFANIYMNPVESKVLFSNDQIKSQVDDTSRTLRKLSCELRGCLQSIPFYWIFWLLRIIPSKKNARDVAANLIGISNSLFYPSGGDDFSRTDANLKRRDKIVKLLKLHSID